MKIDFATAMGRVLEQVRAGDLGLATRTIQAALAPRAGTAASAGPREETPAGLRPRLPPPGIDEAEIIEDRPRARPEAHPAPQPAHPPRRSLREVVAALSRIKRPSWPQAAPEREIAVPPGARFESRSFSGVHGARDYRLYIPAALPEGGRGLVLMLHGCTQDAADFAAGTRMNEQAERQGLLVVYPNQTRHHNAQGCWNWFRPTDQRAEAGEPALLAGLVRAVAAEFAVEPGRIFVAGLSAGGAMAATLAATHPELFAAAGIHSGLPHGAAHDVISAFAAMRGEVRPPTTAGAAVPTIVFHGTADTTVHPANAEAILAAIAGPGQGPRQTERGRAADGRGYLRETVPGPDGQTLAELWRIEGAGHAWSGGAPGASYTDPSGPDASAEMIRFFLQAR